MKHTKQTMDKKDRQMVIADFFIDDEIFGNVAREVIENAY